MGLFDRILVPLDGSGMAEAVLGPVRALLHAADASVTLVQVVPLLAAPEPPWTELPPGLSMLRSEAETYVESIRNRLDSEGARVRSIIRIGFPAEAILDIAGEEKSTLIIMTTHGRTGLARWAHGSVAEKILRSSPIPVLAIRSFGPGTISLAGVASGDAPSYGHCLVCLDLSDLSLKVVPAAVELAAAFASRVTLMNVVEDSQPYGPPVPNLNRAYEMFREAGVPVEPVLRKGDPAAQILDACTELRADLVALATHGRSGLKRWALGSVAERVLRSAPVPLLLVRAGSAPKANIV